MGICKIKLKKSVEHEYQSPYIALLGYRNTIINSVGFSPAEMLMSKKLKGKLPVLLRPKYINLYKMKDSLKMRKSVQMQYYNRYTKKFNEFRPQEDVYS